MVNGDTLSGSLARTAGQNVGTYAINQGNLAASTNYTVSFVGNSFTITPASLSVAATPVTTVYGTYPGLGYTASGLTNGDTSSVISGALTRTGTNNVGTYSILQGTLGASSNYTVTFTGATYAITPAALTVAATPVTTVYGTYPGLGYTASGLTNGDTSSVITGVLTRTGTNNVGTYSILQGTIGASSNYTINYVGATYAITPAALNVAATPVSTVYGTYPGLGYTASGLTNGDTSSVITGALTRTGTNNVGTYSILQGTLGASSNYTVNYTGATYAITPAALLVNAPSVATTYGTYPGIGYTASGLTNGDTGSVITGAPTRGTNNNVGSYAITQGTLAASSNYTVTFTGGSYVITPATLGVVAAPGSKVYGNAEPTLGYTASGLTNGDTSSVVTGGLARTPGQNVGTYGINQGNLMAGSNYVISFTGNTFTITPAPLTVAANPTSTVYGTYPAPTYVATGLTNGDTSSTITGTLARTPGNNVGTYGITQGTVGAGSNYTITYVGNSYVITPAPLPVNANPVTTVYGTYPTGTYTVPPAGLKNGDTTSVVTGTLNTPSGVGIGTYTIGQGTVGAGSNYTIVYTGSSYVITPAPLTITTAPTTTTYGTPTTVTYTPVGLTNGDTTSTITGTFAPPPSSTSVGTYTIGQGTVTGSTNYTTTYVGGSVVINPAPLLITANDATRPLGTPDPTFTATFSGLVLGQSSSVVTGLQITSNDTPASLPGLYSIIPANGMAANYTITYANGTLTVTPVDQPPSTPQGPITPVTPTTPTDNSLTLAGLLASQIQGNNQAAQPNTSQVTCIKVNPDRRRNPSLQDINRTDCEAPLQIQGF